MKRDQYRGFTLIETIVTIVVLSVIAFSVMHIMTEGFRVWSENKNYIELRADGRFALTRLAAEFRQAESVTLGNAADISFNSDFNNDGSSETTRYYLNGRDLMRSGSVICGDVSALTFSWAPPILSIEMTLSKEGDEVKLKTRITARCLPQS